MCFLHNMPSIAIAVLRERFPSEPFFLWQWHNYLNTFGKASFICMHVVHTVSKTGCIGLVQPFNFLLVLAAYLKIITPARCLFSLDYLSYTLLNLLLVSPAFFSAFSYIWSHFKYTFWHAIGSVSRTIHGKQAGFGQMICNVIWHGVISTYLLIARTGLNVYQIILPI